MTPKPKKKGRLTLIGAGPGDPELITVKGARAIGEADLILHDALVHEDLLAYASPEAKVEYAGKRAGGKRVDQERINERILEMTLQGKEVVRLKGGDPFVLARGQEEQKAAETVGVEVRAIPGLSSATAIPSTLGLPLTQRGVNEGFRVLTAVDRHRRLSPELKEAVGSDATLVVLMGIRRAEEIQKLFKEAGKADIPALMVQNGTLPDEKRSFGTSGTLTEMVEKDGIVPPGLILIGETVRQTLEYELKTRSHAHARN